MEKTPQRPSPVPLQQSTKRHERDLGQQNFPSEQTLGNKSSPYIEISSDSDDGFDRERLRRESTPITPPQASPEPFIIESSSNKTSSRTSSKLQQQFKLSKVRMSRSSGEDRVRSTKPTESGNNEQLSSSATGPAREPALVNAQQETPSRKPSSSRVLPKARSIRTQLEATSLTVARPTKLRASSAPETPQTLANSTASAHRRKSAIGPEGLGHRDRDVSGTSAKILGSCVDTRSSPSFTKCASTTIVRRSRKARIDVLGTVSDPVPVSDSSENEEEEETAHTIEVAHKIHRRLNGSEEEISESTEVTIDKTDDESNGDLDELTEEALEHKGDLVEGRINDDTDREAPDENDPQQTELGSESNESVSAIDSDDESLVIHPLFTKYHSERHTQNEIDNRLLQIIKTRKSCGGKVGLKDDCGHIYSYTLLSHPKYVKIGMTMEKIGSSQRVKQQKDTCNQPYVRQIDPEDRDRPFVNFRLAEALVHTQLHNERQSFRCSKCKIKTNNTPVNHCEWFEISVEEGHKVINLWRQWLAYSNPYDIDGKLKPYWRWRFEKLGHYRNRPEVESIVWEDWLSRPTIIDYCGFCLNEAGNTGTLWDLLYETHPREHFLFWLIWLLEILYLWKQLVMLCLCLAILSAFFGKVL